MTLFTNAIKFINTSIFARNYSLNNNKHPLYNMKPITPISSYMTTNNKGLLEVVFLVNTDVGQANRQSSTLLTPPKFITLTR